MAEVPLRYPECPWCRLVLPNGSFKNHGRGKCVPSELDAQIAHERLDAAQKEWERHDRVNRIAALGLAQVSTDIRSIAKRQNFSAADERDLERHADHLLETAAQLSGDGWLKSPLAMGGERALNQADGAR